MTRKWNFVNDQSTTNYTVGNEIIFSTKVLKSNHCNFNDAYVLVRGVITILWLDAATQVTFKNCASFTVYLTKDNGRKIDVAEDLVSFGHANVSLVRIQFELFWHDR